MNGIEIAFGVLEVVFPVVIFGYGIYKFGGYRGY